MSRLRAETNLLAAAFVMISCSPASAVFDQWRFTEFFSNADGTVQFIELRCGNFNNQNGATDAHLHSSSTNKLFFFPANLPTSTANKSLLVASDNFESLPGAVTPDFAAFSGLPPNFFNPAGDTVTLFVNGVAGSVDFRTFPSVPTDGVTSRNYPANTLGPNSPTNFAGQTGSIDLSLLPGDYNDDGTVDADDYVFWRARFGNAVTPSTSPDGSGNGTVDAADYAIWRDRLGAGAMLGSNAFSLPEPSAIAIVVIMGIALVACPPRTINRRTTPRIFAPARRRGTRFRPLDVARPESDHHSVMEEGRPVFPPRRMWGFWSRQ